VITRAAIAVGTAVDGDAGAARRSVVKPVRSQILATLVLLLGCAAPSVASVCYGPADERTLFFEQRDVAGVEAPTIVDVMHDRLRDRARRAIDRAAP
jgi:hypothetical protein